MTQQQRTTRPPAVQPPSDRCATCGESPLVCRCPVVPAAPEQGAPDAAGPRVSCWWCGTPQQVADRPCDQCRRIV